MKNKIENMQHVLYVLVAYIHNWMSRRGFPTCVYGCKWRSLKC